MSPDRKISRLPFQNESYPNGLSFECDSQLDDVTISKIYVLHTNDQSIGTIHTEGSQGRQEMQITESIDWYLIQGQKPDHSIVWYRLNELPSQVAIQDYTHEDFYPQDYGSPTFDPMLQIIIDFLTQNGSRRLRAVDINGEIKKQ